MGSSFPKPLTCKEEEYYLKRFEEGDLEAKNTLIVRNLRLVAHIVKKYSTGNSNPDDLISIGTIGLIKAINTYSSKRATRLATYAAKCIENEILMSIRSDKKRKMEISLNEPIVIILIILFFIPGDYTRLDRFHPFLLFHSVSKQALGYT